MRPSKRPLHLSGARPRRPAGAGTSARGSSGRPSRRTPSRSSGSGCTAATSDTPHTGDLLNSIGRITGLLGAYAALLQVLLLARLPWIERAAGFDRLTVWHRWNGHACLYLVLAHVVFSVYGYALLDKISAPARDLHDARRRHLSRDDHGHGRDGAPPRRDASSIVIVRRQAALRVVVRGAPDRVCIHRARVVPPDPDGQRARPRPDGRELLARALRRHARAARRLAPPPAGVAGRAARAARRRKSSRKGPASSRFAIGGRNLRRLRAQAGQFFLWRFLARDRWWVSHPFSLSAAPDGRSLRITVKALGDHSARLAALKPGTRVVAEGPFGVFTARARRREKVLLVAGGIGITPVRALLEQLDGDVTVLYRVVARGGRALPPGARRRWPGARRPDRIRRRRPHDARRTRPALAGPPARARPGPRRARRLPLRPARDDRRPSGAALRAAGVRRRHVHVERFAL